MDAFTLKEILGMILMSSSFTLGSNYMTQLTIYAPVGYAGSTVSINFDEEIFSQLYSWICYTQSKRATIHFSKPPTSTQYDAIKFTPELSIPSKNSVMPDVISCHIPNYSEPLTCTKLDQNTTCTAGKRIVSFHYLSPRVCFLDCVKILLNRKVEAFKYNSQKYEIRECKGGCPTQPPPIANSTRPSNFIHNSDGNTTVTQLPEKPFSNLVSGTSQVLGKKQGRRFGLLVSLSVVCALLVFSILIVLGVVWIKKKRQRKTRQVVARCVENFRSSNQDTEFSTYVNHIEENRPVPSAPPMDETSLTEFQSHVCSHGIYADANDFNCMSKERTKNVHFSHV